MAWIQNYGSFNGIQILQPTLPQTRPDNCSHIGTSVHIDRTIRLGYSCLNPPYKIEQNPLTDAENWEIELRNFRPRRWSIWDILQKAESDGFICWNGNRQTVKHLKFIDKIGDDTISVNEEAVSDLLRRYKSIVGVIRIKPSCYFPDEVWYIDNDITTHLDTHAVAIFGEYYVTLDEFCPKGTYWVVQDSGALSPQNPFGIMFVSASLLIEAYSCLTTVQPVLMSQNFNAHQPYPPKEDTTNDDMDPLFFLNDPRWSNPLEFLMQSVPPPVLLQKQTETSPVSRDLEPGPAETAHVYQHLHIPADLMHDFLKLTNENTSKNLEFCGILAGSLKNGDFHMTALIIPKQQSTSYSCEALNEEEIFEVQENQFLQTLGWIHTHPTQACFMSSVDLHTHYPYQIMLPEAIAIVMAPTDSSRPYGIFHLSNPVGVSVIKNCEHHGFHSHELPEDGSPLYRHCSHVYINPELRFDIIDLR